MPSVHINKAQAAFTALCDLAKINNPSLTASGAINKVLADPVGREAFTLSLAEGQQRSAEFNRRYTGEPAQPAEAGMRPPFHAEHNVSGEAALGRLRAGHAHAKT